MRLHRLTLLKFYQESVKGILSHSQFQDLQQTELMIQTICFSQLLLFREGQVLKEQMLQVRLYLYRHLLKL